MIKSPKLFKNILSKEDYEEIKSYFYNLELLKDINFDGECGRKIVHSDIDNMLKKYSEKFLPLVRDYFEDDSILPTYSIFAEYSDRTISLEKHRDANACTYTVDLALYHKNPWGLWVDGIEYLANENDGLLFCGEDQRHWRETINSNEDRIGVIFFHYVTPDHWFFTKGKDYVQTILKEKREYLLGE